MHISKLNQKKIAFKNKNKNGIIRLKEKYSGIKRRKTVKRNEYQRRKKKKMLIEKLKLHFVHRTI